MLAFVVMISTSTANADGLLDYISNQPAGTRKGLALIGVFLVLLAIKWFWQTTIGKSKEGK